jgi:cytochrome c oxidase assembly factor 3
MPVYVLRRQFFNCSLTDNLRRIPRSSYYDKHYKQSAALIRARRPYLIKNSLTGLGLFAFCIGVCKFGIKAQVITVLTCFSVDSFTIKAVSQDDFEDVQVPDTPAQSPQPGSGTIAGAPALK